jgi:hypothetical protein
MRPFICFLRCLVEAQSNNSCGSFRVGRLLMSVALTFHRLEPLRSGFRAAQPNCGELEPSGFVLWAHSPARHPLAFVSFGSVIAGFDHRDSIPKIGVCSNSGQLPLLSTSGSKDRIWPGHWQNAPGDEN